MNRSFVAWPLAAILCSACAPEVPPAAPPAPPPEPAKVVVAIPVVASAQQASPPAVQADPPTRQMSSQEWEKVRGSGAFAPIELPLIGERREVDAFKTSPRFPSPGVVRTTDCQPGGSSEGFFSEKGSGALFMIRTVGGLSVPRGVSISATRCFEAHHKLPEGRMISGVIEISYPNKVGH